MLNRFTLDYNTFQRVKLHDRVSFPLQVNLNDYLKGYEGISAKKYEKEVDMMNTYAKTTVESNLKGEVLKKTKLEDLQSKGKEDVKTKQETQIKIVVAEDELKPEEP